MRALAPRTESGQPAGPVHRRKLPAPPGAWLRQRIARALASRTPPILGPTELRQNRIYVLPTVHGLVFGLTLILMLIGSVNYDLSLGFVLTFTLLGMGLAAIVQTVRNLLHLRISPGRGEPVFAGQTARIGILLDNPDGPARYRLHLCRGPSRSSVDLPAGTQQRIDVPVPAERRGWLAAGRLRLESRYPLGLFRAWSSVHPAARVLVYPAPVHTPLPAAGGAPGNGTPAPDSPGEEDFAGLRAYQPGDPPRRLAWRTLARGGPLSTKHWAGDRAGTLWLDWSALAPDLPLETRLSRLTGWVLQADRAGLSFGLNLPDLRINPDRGVSHRNACLQALALFGEPAAGAGA
jgi:uncharacterized protein (DUF58 family)